MNTTSTRGFLANALAPLAVLLGLVAIGTGAAREARASGASGACKGQYLETKINGIWTKVWAGCGGLCPLPANSTHSTFCQQSLLSPARVTINGKDYLQYKCACVEYSDDGLIYAIQMDGGNGQSSSCCDTLSRYDANTGLFYNAFCSGSCANPACTQTGVLCDDNAPVYIDEMDRVISCSCK